VSKCKPPTVADVAGAAQRRRVVCSAGSLDAPLLQALQRAQLAAGVCGDKVSTWGEGVSIDIPGGAQDDTNR